MTYTNVAPLGQAAFLQEGNVKITPAQAGYVLREHGYDRNRKVSRSPGHVSTLAEIMRRGKWLPKSQIAFARHPDGRMTLINGHHRMAAQAESGADVVWNITIYDVADDAGLQAIYTRLDTNIKVRTEQNIIGAYDYAETNGLTKLGAKALYRAAPILGNNLLAAAAGHSAGAANYHVRIAEDRIAIMDNYINEARALDVAIASASTILKRKLYAGGITAVALATFRADSAKAYGFWHGIAENDGLRKGDPRATLIQWLMEGGSNKGQSQKLIAGAARAWNYWVSGNDLKSIRLGGNGFNLAGTTYWVTV